MGASDTDDPYSFDDLKYRMAFGVTPRMSRFDVNQMLDDYQHPLLRLGFESEFRNWDTRMIYVPPRAMHRLFANGACEKRVHEVVRKELPAHIAITWPRVHQLEGVGVYEMADPVWT